MPTVSNETMLRCTCMKKRRESKVGEAPRFRNSTITTSPKPRMSVSRIGRNVREWLQS